jgi:L-lactate dehydrogenase complex protein LldE
VPLPVPGVPNDTVSHSGLSETAVRAQVDEDACTVKEPTVSGVAGTLRETGLSVKEHCWAGARMTSEKNKKTTRCISPYCTDGLPRVSEYRRGGRRKRYNALFMGKRVSLFVTCIVDQLFPRVGLAMADVLERIGYAADFPEQQTCCGQPAFNSGYREEARQVARHFLRVFEGAEYVVVPSGSCTSMITHHYEDLFQKEPEWLERARRLGPRVWEFSRFLIEVAGVEDVGARFEHVVTFHDSCHALRELGVKDGPRRLLGRVRGLELREMSIPEECCGFGGTFSVKFADVSGGMARTKVESILATGADTVVGVDSSCLMQIGGVMSRAGLPVATMHLAEVLAAR